MATNNKIETPLGEGTEQGNFELRDGNGAVIAVHKLVRFVLNDETASHLQDSNCLTPRAKVSALFHFPAGEGGGSCSEYAILIALVVIVLMFAGYIGWPW
jgi:hypothetical protein